MPIKIQVHAAGVNRADILQLEGKYPSPDGNKTPGLEVSGIRMDTNEKVCALLTSGGYNRIYAKTLETLEKTLGSTQALRNNGMGLTFWVSGLYSQGQSKPIYGNPSMKDHHYGIISGCHYIHKPTGQTIGLALDIGLGNSFANVDHEMKGIHHTGQMTVY